MKRTIAAAVAAAFLIVGLANPVSAQDEDIEPGWSFESEVSGVWIGGNSVSRTVGVDATAIHGWDKSVFRIQGGGFRTESTVKNRYAVGSEEEFRIEEKSETATTAEAYFGRSSYEYRFSEKSFVIGGVDWLRNTFSGIDSRFLLGLGTGHFWVNRERTKFETTAGFTYTFESEVVENPFNTGKFPGLRLSYFFESQVTASTKLRSRFASDWNLDNTADLRLDFTNSIYVSIASMLALKPSLRFQWRNDPALKSIPLQDANGNDTGLMVVVPLRKLDSFFTLALVVTL